MKRVFWAERCVIVNDFPVEACWIAWKQLRNEAVDKFVLLVYVRLTFYKLPRYHHTGCCGPKEQNQAMPLCGHLGNLPAQGTEWQHARA